MTLQHKGLDPLTRRRDTVLINCTVLCVLMLGPALSLSVAAAFADATQTLEEQLPGEWIREMKEESRGPFQRIRWFCNDGSILPPAPSACASHGGGVQHGEWNDRVRKIRTAGYPIANVLADLHPTEFTDSTTGLEQLKFLLLEQFLIAADDGWILRQARFYRGAFQVEGETRSAARILQAIVVDPNWQNRFSVLYEAVRLLPHGEQTSSMTEIRGLAARLNQQDPGFAPLRNKIHGKPDVGDADRVRDYASNGGLPELQDEYGRLAHALEVASTAPAIPHMLRHLALAVDNSRLQYSLREGADRLDSAQLPAEQLRVSSELLALLRDQFRSIDGPASLEVFDTALGLERQIVLAGQALTRPTTDGSRAERLEWLRSGAQALYGVGLLTSAEWQQIQQATHNLNRDGLSLAEYRKELRYLARIPDWANKRLEFHFGLAIKRLAEIEPLALSYIPDRLRGSPLLFFANILETLVYDASLLSETQHDFFGEPLTRGLRSVNAGIAYGVIRTLDDVIAFSGVGYPSILVVPATLADLPPAAGILTADEGNPLSHVQLLARNLGLPNVVVSQSLMHEVLARRGKAVSLVTSPGGIVQLREIDLEAYAEYPKIESEASRGPIRVDQGKLDLNTLDILPVNQLRATDSGVIVGPKAAHLGELTHRFHSAVSPALAIPFGVFRQMLEQPIEPGGPTAFEWIKAQYVELGNMDGGEYRMRREQQFLSRLRAWITDSEFDPVFREELRQAMEQQFGADGTYGVFVRSDTNVEDLPGFSGAGLNLTVPNVVGFESVLQAIREVWASPFSERAYGWRQARMDQPEHVYAAVLLHLSVPVEKSGVLITADVDTKARDVLSVVVNEGVGGAVEGQSAESLRIHMDSGRVRLLASATEPLKRVLLKDGGSHFIPASGRDRLLDDGDIRQLVQLARELPGWFSNLPGLEPEQSADVEFGFLDGELILFQIRPFVDNVVNNQILLKLDASAAKTAMLPVQLGQRPLGTTP